MEVTKPMSERLEIEEDSSEVLLVQLSEYLLVSLPDIKELGIRVYPDLKKTWIDFERLDGKAFSVWQWKPKSPTIFIGKGDYEIKDDILVEFKSKKIIPLKKDKRGMKIIDLTLVEEKEVKDFLDPTSLIKKEE